jgi:hypothetical protein
MCQPQRNCPCASFFDVRSPVRSTFGIRRFFTSSTASKIVPNVPTITELGFDDVSVANSFGVAAALGTPSPIIAKLNADFA